MKIMALVFFGIALTLLSENSIWAKSNIQKQPSMDLNQLVKNYNQNLSKARVLEFYGTRFGESEYKYLKSYFDENGIKELPKAKWIDSQTVEFEGKTKAHLSFPADVHGAMALNGHTLDFTDKKTVKDRIKYYLRILNSTEKKSTTKTSLLSLFESQAWADAEYDANKASASALATAIDKLTHDAFAWRDSTGTALLNQFDTLADYELDGDRPMKIELKCDYKLPGDNSASDVTGEKYEQLTLTYPDNDQVTLLAKSSNSLATEYGRRRAADNSHLWDFDFTKIISKESSTVNFSGKPLKDMTLSNPKYSSQSPQKLGLALLKCCEEFPDTDCVSKAQKAIKKDMGDKYVEDSVSSEGAK